MFLVLLLTLLGLAGNGEKKAHTSTRGSTSVWEIQKSSSQNQIQKKNLEPNNNKIKWKMKRLNFKLFERRKTGKSLPIKISLKSRLETNPNGALKPSEGKGKYKYIISFIFYFYIYIYIYIYIFFSFFIYFLNDQKPSDLSAVTRLSKPKL